MPGIAWAGPGFFLDRCTWAIRFLGQPVMFGLVAQLSQSSSNTHASPAGCCFRAPEVSSFEWLAVVAVPHIRLV